MSNHDQSRHEDAVAVEVGEVHQVDAEEVEHVLVEDAIEATAEDAVVDRVHVGATVDEVVEEDAEGDEDQVHDEVGEAVVLGSIASATMKAATLL